MSPRGTRAGGIAVMPLALLTCLGAACARPPAALRGEFPPTTVADVQARATVGERVRWGGVIVRTTPGAEDTCFEVMSKPLDRRAEPRTVDESYGRFVACVAGFYDPAIYAEDREVTVVGTVEGFVDGQVGERPYRFPKVRTEIVHLWPKREPRPVIYYYDPWPFLGPYPYWGWFGGVRVVRPRPHPPRR